MKSALTPAQRFTMRRLILFLITQWAVIVALELYWRWRSGKWTATSLAVIPIALWVYLAFSYRWLAVMKQVADGSFSEDEYRANPMGYMMGNSKQRLVFVVGMVIALICVIGITASGWQ